MTCHQDSSRRIWMLKLILLLIWVGLGPNYPKMLGFKFSDPSTPLRGPPFDIGTPRAESASISASTGWILMILRSFWGFFMMLNPFMILSKQLQVVLTHFRWKILIFGVAERQTRDYYRFKKTPIM